MQKISYVARSEYAWTLLMNIHQQMQLPTARIGCSNVETYLSVGMPSKPQNARFHANSAKWNPAAPMASICSLLIAHAASFLTRRNSLALHTTPCGILRGWCRATSRCMGISCREMTTRLALVLASPAAGSIQCCQSMPRAPRWTGRIPHAITKTCCKHEIS